MLLEIEDAAAVPLRTALYSTLRLIGVVATHFLHSRIACMCVCSLAAAISKLIATHVA